MMRVWIINFCLLFWGMSEIWAASENIVSPDVLACSTDGKTLWVGNRFSSELLKVDSRTLAVKKRIALNAPVTAITVMPDGSLWVSSDGVSGKLYKIDGRSMKVLGAFDTGYSPSSLLIDSSGKAVWATLRYNNEIRKYDCVYVDYEMDQMTAFDFFEQTKQMKYLKIIITKYDHVVYKSFDYNIFDFVRKNNLKEDMSNKVGRLLKRLEEDHRCLIVSSFNQILTLPYETIQYIHTEKNYVIIHSNKEYKVRSTFKDIEKKIKNNTFITISYGILVNMHYIKHINLKEMYIILADNTQLSLSYKYKTKVKNAYQEYKIQ